MAPRSRSAPVSVSVRAGPLPEASLQAAIAFCGCGCGAAHASHESVVSASAPRDSVGRGGRERSVVIAGFTTDARTKTSERGCTSSASSEADAGLKQQRSTIEDKA